MNDDHASTQVSPYLAYYGMTREAFAPAIEDDLFYAEATRKQRLEILLHLTQYGSELMLVIGPEGSGKTTLLQQFRRQALDNWSIARIEANGGIDERQLLQQLFHQLHLDFSGPTKNDLYATLRHHYDALQRSARQGIIVVDDAEHLDITSLKSILHLATLKNNQDKPILRVILFGNEELKAHLKDAQLGHLAGIPQREIDLPPFDQEQTSHYVLHRLSAANFSAPQPFTDAALHKIYKQSGGWPKRINELAHAILLKSLPADLKQDKQAIKIPVSFRPLRLAALLLTVGIIVALLVYQDEVNRWINPQPGTPLPLVLPEPAAPMADRQEPQVVTAADDSEAAAPLQQEVRQTTASAEADTQAQDSSPQLEIATPEITADPAMAEQPLPDEEPFSANTPDTTPATSAPREQTVAAATEQAVSSAAQPDTTEINAEAAQTPEPAASPAATIAPAKEMEKTAEPSPTVTPKDTPKVEVASPQPTPATNATTTADLSDPRLGLPEHQNQWLREQAPTDYTLQIVAGNNLETITRFIAEHKLSSNLALYQTTRQDKPWYGLVYGLYANKQQAIAARNSLPEPLRRLQPWIRELRGIQDSLP